LIGKELGMFVERRKVETTADPNSLSDAELIELINGSSPPSSSPH
jgi:hypothetical protein